jgi:hypothetical protein
MGWFQILMLFIGLVGLAGIWGGYIRLGEIMIGLSDSNNDWQRKKAHEEMLKDIAGINMQGRNAVEQLRLIQSDMGSLRSDVRAMWSPETVKRSQRRGYLGS